MIVVMVFKSNFLFIIDTQLTSKDIYDLNMYIWFLDKFTII